MRAFLYCRKEKDETKAHVRGHGDAQLIVCLYYSILRFINRATVVSIGSNPHGLSNVPPHNYLLELLTRLLNCRKGRTKA